MSSGIDTYPPQNVSAQTPTLGYAQTTTSTVSITTVSDIQGLAATITVPAGRRIRISSFNLVYSSVDGDMIYTSIREGGTYLQYGQAQTWTQDGSESCPSVVLTPSAGTHTYKISVERATGTGAVVHAASATYPAYILVEDITGSQLPVLPQSVPVGVVAQKRTTTISAAYDTWGLITELSMTAPPFVSGRQYEVTVHGFMDASADSEWTLYAWFGETNAQQLARRKVLAGDIVEFHGGGLFSPVDGGNLGVFAVRQSGTGTLQIGGMDADHASWVIIKDVTPTPAPGQGAPGSTLGYSQIVADQAGITTATDIAGLAVTVTVPAGRRLRISSHTEVKSSQVGDLMQVTIQEGAAILQYGQVRANGTAAEISDPEVIITPSAGTHTYKLALTRGSGSGSLTMTAAATYPAFILVEDITGAVWPVGSTVTAGMVASEPWTAWTPTLNGGTLGNGTLTARYIRIGRVVTLNFQWTFGSTSDITTWFDIGNLPVAATAMGAVGTCIMQDFSTSFRATGAAQISGTSVYLFVSVGGQGGHVNNTYPWDWAVSDFISFTVTYEAAS